MNINDIITRLIPAPPWVDGEKIPWNEPEFSRRALEDHLTQNHDWASRRDELIDRHVAWINGRLKPGSRILDLACGPGLYTQRLTRQGHSCLGVDFSPASIGYAREKAAEAGLTIEYVLEDIRRFSTDETFDCVMFVFGEFNVFTEDDARAILATAAKALKPGGLFILEGHTYEAVRETGQAPASWWTAEAGEGLLSARAHLCLQENFWDEDTAIATTRYYAIDGETAEVTRFCSAMTAYSMKKYEQLFTGAGFQPPRRLAAKDWPAGGPFEGAMVTFYAQK